MATFMIISSLLYRVHLVEQGMQKVGGLTQDVKDLSRPGYPELTMEMSNEDHSFLYE